MNRSFYQKRTKHWIRFILVSALVLSALVLHSTPTFATLCTGSTLDASGGSATCDMTVNATVSPGVLTLANDAAAVVTGTPFTLTGAAQTPSITFTSVVKDHRGLKTGWALEANSVGLTLSGATTLVLKLTGEAATSSCTNGTCPALTLPANTAGVFTTPITLTATPAKFVQAGTSVVDDGDYTNNTVGSITIPQGASSGAYSGTITITLLNAF